ncbi:MAG: hypothetical protein ABI761_03300 [Saprospiraceae bacterium]
MKRIIKIALFLFCTSFSFVGCIKESLNFVGEMAAPGAYPNVDMALWPYFKRFEDEAALRDINVDLQNAHITGFISDIPTEHVQGLCSHSSSDPKKVTVDLPFWDRASDQSREFVIFHELGHCYLGRSHDESKDSDGFCLSIMRSSQEDCRDNYTEFTRKKYLDELFSQD